MTKAYKNLDFLNSPNARPLRVLSEYLEPQSRFREHHVQRAVIFFGSARLRRGAAARLDGRDYYQEASDLASGVARWTLNTHERGERFHICTGGGPGIMEAANRGVSIHDPELSVGLNISAPNEQQANPFLSPELSLEFHYFFMRKFWFLNLAHALVVFPGGFGTMDELFEVLTLQQTGKKSRIPILLYGRRFWKRLIDFDLFVEEGLISKSDLDFFHIVDNEEEALSRLTTELRGSDRTQAESS